MQVGFSSDVDNDDGDDNDVVVDDEGGDVAYAQAEPSAAGAMWCRCTRGMQNCR